MPKRVVVLGNCQAQMIEGLIARAEDVVVDRLPPVFAMQDSQKTNVLKKLDSADHIFAQRVTDTYHLPWLQSNFLTALYGQRCLIWPNLYFDGYSPSIRYLYLDGVGKVKSPLDDYHFDDIIKSFRSGLSITTTVAFLNDDTSKPEDPFEQSLQQLRDRERDCHVVISDEMEQAVYRRQCFYTANHPDSPILSAMTARLAKAADMRYDEEDSIRYVGRLDTIVIPPFERITRRYKLQFQPSGEYSGVELTHISAERIATGGKVKYSLASLIEQYYRIYDAVLKT
jgi:hypothetical protein